MAFYNSFAYMIKPAVVQVLHYYQVNKKNKEINEVCEQPLMEFCYFKFKVNIKIGSYSYD